MILNEQIWGSPDTYVSVVGGDISGAFWRTQRVYADILYDNPALQYPYYDKSTYRWGIPADCSVGHFSTCSWWVDNGTIKYDIKEHQITGVVGFTVGLNPTSTYSEWQGSSTYAFSIDCHFKYPPYQKMRATIISESGSLSWTGASSQPYLHWLKFNNYSNYWSATIPQCARYNYNKNVYLLSASWINLKGNYISDTLVENYSPEVFTGELDKIISHMRIHYNSDIAAGKSVNPEDYAIIGIGGDIYTQRDTISRVHPLYAIPTPTTFPTYEPSQRWKSIYYQDTELEPVAIHNSYRQLSIGCGASIQLDQSIVSKNLNYFGSYSSLPTPTTLYNGLASPISGLIYAMLPCDQCLPASSKKQVYSDVSYHWEWHMRRQYKSFSFDDGVPDLPPASTADYDTMVSIYPVLIIDNYDINIGDYFDACRVACLHEMSFYGLPLCTNYTAATSAMWSPVQESIYIPEFDGHMITTGNFVTLKRSYELDSTGQFDWGNIFGSVDAINDYDADYRPPVHRDDNDFGDIYNKGSYRYFPSGHHIYKLNATELTQFMQAVSSLYLTDPDGVEKWTLDFKGVNPNDYIVGIYATVYDAPKKSAQEHLKINNIDLYDISSSYVADAVDFTRSGKYDCGSIYISPYYNDFRDYPPYTVAELYVPLCGTVDIDLAFFMGHYMQLIYWIDILTMQCSASIYRDGDTLYKTINGTIGAQIPILSKNMGDYQNALHQLQQADKQNNIRLATSVLSTAVGTAAILAAPETGGLSLAAGAGILGGIAGITSGAINKSDIEYQLSHKQPAVSQTGAISPQNDFCVGSMIPKLWIKRPKMLSTYDADTYSHTIGNACCINGTLGSVSGYTVATNVNLSGFNATAEEKSMIKELLSGGVYL